MNILFIFLFLVFGFLILAIAVANITPHVTVHFLYREFLDVPLGFVMLGCLAAGVIIAFAMGLPEMLRLRFQNRQLRKRLRHLEGRPGPDLPEAPTGPAPTPHPDETLGDADPPPIREFPP